MGYLICSKCHSNYSLDEPRWRCDCGCFIDIVFEPKIDKNIFERKFCSMWKYKDAIPINQEQNIVSLNEGFTPLIKYNTSDYNLFLKLDFLFPTGSYKDRGASVLISKAKELKVNKVIEDSSGNAGCAIAAYAAIAKIGCEIYVPKDTSLAKLTQIKAFGAKLKIIDGNRTSTAKQALRDAQNTYYASHTWNPFFLQGTKTIAYEIFEQLNFACPDMLIMPTGNGTLFLGAYIGFKELMHNGLIKKMPKLIAVQPKNYAPLYKQLKNNLDYTPSVEENYTIAEGVAINNPLRGNQIIKTIKETNGDCIIVNDSETKEALIELASNGIYVEPTAALSFAGAKNLKIKNQEKAICILTGSGLKTNEKITRIIENS